MQKRWLGAYPQGVPAEIPAPPFRSLRDLIEHAFREYADRPAYTNMGTTLTYRDLDRLSLEFARYLQSSLGMTRGERIAIMLPNVLQFPVVLCGALRAGLVVVNANPLYTARELRHLLVDSGARTIVVLENFAHVLEQAATDTPVKNVVTTGVGDLLRWPANMLTNLVVKHIRRSVPRYSLPASKSFTSALQLGREADIRHVELGFADIAFLQYTGGTTGISKGAMLSHRNMVYNVFQTNAWTGGIFDDIDRVVAITALPLYHIFSLKSNCLLMMWLGGENVLITNPRDTKGFVRELGRHRYSYFTGVNTMFSALLAEPGFAALDFSALRLTIGGGMAVQEAVARKWRDVTGRPIVQAYGLTETSPAVTINPLDSTEFTGSIGLPVPSTDIRICDDDGNDTELGEICIRGPQVMEGYWRNQEETDKVMMPGGWLRSGDIGRMDERGFVFIEDRKKDMVLVSGFNVYPNEIEGLVVEMDGILEAAAIGVPDESSGEAVKLFVVRNDPSITAADVLAHCRKFLTAYKIPREVEFRISLPKSNVGKILRRALRDNYR
ncbi:MAG: AMP-binding protein [Gammaproteobacteria bacterium]|nr:AMP-binding protein [Gammaproteobacteria bacterium]MDH5345385.1 AMP-binding protein [Gammaproteobacteria bacterium]